MSTEVPAIIVLDADDVIAAREEWAANAFQREYDAVTANRQQGYQQTSDPIFMQYQRGETTEQAWLDAVQAVKDANPYPVQGK